MSSIMEIPSRRRKPKSRWAGARFTTPRHKNLPRHSRARRNPSAVGVSLVGTLAAVGVWVNHQGCPYSGDTYPMEVAGEEHR